MAKELDSATTSTVLGDDTGVHDAEFYIEHILSIHQDLSSRIDLRPCASINAIFGDLVTLCTKILSQEVTEAILEDKRVEKILPELRDICGQAECLLETHWAEHISRGSKPHEVRALLSKFPYYQNYINLTRLELAAMNAATPIPPRKIAFIGSGPLPLTSLCLLDSLDASPKSKLHRSLFQRFISWFSPASSTVLNIDYSPTAIALSSRLCAKLSSPTAKRMSFLLHDANSPVSSLESPSSPSQPLLDTFDVVYIAALVGTSQAQKTQTILLIASQMRLGSLIIIRTSWGLRRLLYPDFDPTTREVLSALEICNVVHPYDHVVNSVIVARVKQRSRNFSIGSRA